jgi:phosphoribosylformimino-5-aminoimidazole carboxamide ribotide isomerase/phosphoribosylanthranilate isomerase
MTQSLELLPAIDISEGRAVRIAGGDASAQTIYGDPVEIVAEWLEAGAKWIHLVDLDAAFGRGDNREAIRQVANLASGVNVQISGGVNTRARLDQALEAGATRVNLATNSLDEPAWVYQAIEELGNKVAVGLDVLGTKLSARGGTGESGDLFEVLSNLEAAGCRRYIVTDVAKDGSLKGPNLELLRFVLAKTNKPVVASGGISSLEDIEELRTLVSLGLEGAILGKALYAGRFTLSDALRTAGAAI